MANMSLQFWNWLLGLDVKIQAALIASITTVAVFLLRDFVLKRVNEKRVNNQKALDVFRLYSDPLSRAAESLFWRLKEILRDEGRAVFLLSGREKDPFHEYKFRSTLYRLSAFIGWIRAYRKQLVYFSLPNDSKIKPLRDALERFEKALADGHKVEEKRLNSIAKTWGLEINTQHSNKCAVALENVLKASVKNADLDLADGLSKEEQVGLCKRLSETLTKILNVDALSESQVLKDADEIIRLLSIREAWLYREYQTGIGDLVLSKTARGEKLYTVIGYEEFEELLLSTEDRSVRWISRIKILFDQLDIDHANGYDARHYMLEQTFIGLAYVLIALGALQKNRQIISTNALNAARDIASDEGWRKMPL